MDINLPIIAGTIATILFAASTLPMVVKAHRTRDLKSYSLGYLVLGNVGNLFYSVYVYSLPPGPIWLLHTFYLIVTGLMLFWYLRYEWKPGMKRRLNDNDTTAAKNSELASTQTTDRTWRNHARSLVS